MTSDRGIVLNDSISLHDHRITGIVENNKTVRVLFDDGLTVIKEGKVTICHGSIEFSDCSFDDIDCIWIKRRVSKDGAKIIGTPLSVSQLMDKIQKNNSALEVITELYNTGIAYWKCEVFPYKRKGLSDQVIICINGFDQKRIVLKNLAITDLTGSGQKR